jgi:hypothetical protein
LGDNENIWARADHGQHVDGKNATEHNGVVHTVTPFVTGTFGVIISTRSSCGGIVVAIQPVFVLLYRPRL